MDRDPPIEDWEQAEALEEILRIARGIGREDFERDVMPRLRRLSRAQRRRVAAAIDDTLREPGPEA